MRRRAIAATAMAITAVVAISVPVMAEIARLEQLPLGSGSATISWTGKSGITPTISSISGTARGFTVVATGRVPKPPSLANPSTPASVPTSYPIADIKGTIGGTSFTLEVAINLRGVNSNSSARAPFGTVTGTFRGQPIRAVLTASATSQTVSFSGTIGGDHVAGTIGRVVRHGNRSTTTAHFDVTR